MWARFPCDPVLVRFPLAAEHFSDVMVLQTVGRYQEVVRDRPGFAGPQGGAADEGDQGSEPVVQLGLVPTTGWIQKIDPLQGFL